MNLMPWEVSNLERLALISISFSGGAAIGVLLTLAMFLGF